MNKELTGISSSGGFEVIRIYNDNKKYHIDQKYISYGDILVQTKRCFSGVNIELQLFFRNQWNWKPLSHWKYGDRYFHWLFFKLFIRKEYVEKIDKIIKDHLKEE